LLLASVIVYLIVTVLIGFWASRKVSSSGDFMLAGRSLPIVLSTSALFATWFGSETVFGASSQFMEGGLFAVIEDPFGASLCLLLFGLFFARKLYNMNLVTLGDYFKVRYGKRTEIIASAFMIPAYFGYIAAQLVALGLILNVVADIPVVNAIVISSLIVTLYTFIGGMWAISVTDFIQSIIIIVGLLVLAFILAEEAGGASVVLSEVPKKDLKFFPEFNSTAIVTWLAAWSVLGLGSIPSQDVFQRTMSSGSAKIAVRSCYYAAILYLTVAMLPLFISLCVKHLYPGELGADTQLTLPNMVLQHTSIPVQIVFFGSLLSAIMSTTSSSMLAPAALFSENVVKPLMKKPPTDKQLLMLTRLSVILFSMIATVMAALNSNIYELVGVSSILTLVSLFIPMVFGMYWKRSSSSGAMLAMISGMIAWFWFEHNPLSVPALVPATLMSMIAFFLGSYMLPDKKVYGKN
jgi:solute:Na+ symporter, SSS family